MPESTCPITREKRIQGSTTWSKGGLGLIDFDKLTDDVNMSLLLSHFEVFLMIGDVLVRVDARDESGQKKFF